jgi:hypothetical protein
MSRIECSLARGSGRRRRYPSPLVSRVGDVVQAGLGWALCLTIIGLYVYGYGLSALKVVMMFVGVR